MSGLLRSMLSISAATFLSRATGYVRIMVFAALLGTGVVSQAFSVASALPNWIYELFLGGIFYSIFIPILIERITNHGEEDAQALTNALFTVALPLLAVVAAFGVVFAEPLVSLATDWQNAEDLSPAGAREQLEISVLLFRIFVLQLVLYGISTIATGVLQSHRYFFLPTFAPVLNNLIIIASFGAYELLDGRDQTLAIYVLALGATLGVAVMALCLVPTMLRLGYKPRIQFGHPALASAARLAGPMLILVAASVGLQAVGYFFATQFNAATQLGLAFVIFSLPYGIFVVAIATALMPDLSEQHSRGDVDGYRDTFSFGLRLVSFVVVPSTIGMFVLAKPIVGLLYERGEFVAQDTQVVATLLQAYAVGLLGYGVYFLLVRAFYSQQNTLTPALLNVVLFALYTGFVYVLSDVIRVVGVVLALSVAYTILAALGLAAMRRRIERIDGRRLLRSLAKILAAGAAMYAVAWGGVNLLGLGTGTLERALVILVVGSVSVAAYLGVALALRAEELQAAIDLARRRLRPKEG
ncbi:MAG: murein biosynthesis integral membrane protein MurJ [Rubrobacteraceae bacterium]